MKLEIPDLIPMEILSEGEIYFLKVIVPFLLLLPWFLALLFFIIRFLIRWLESLKPKDRPLSEPIIESIAPNRSYKEERYLSLKQIEELAKTNPRSAIFELSRFVRAVNLSDEFEKYSLEYYIKKIYPVQTLNWRDIFSTNFRKLLKAPQDLYVDMVFASYQKEEPTLETAIGFVQKIRLLNNKSKGKSK